MKPTQAKRRKIADGPSAFGPFTLPKEIVFMSNTSNQPANTALLARDVSMEEIRAQHLLVEKALQELIAQMDRTDKRMERTDRRLERTDKKLERIGILAGNISNNQGDVAEEFFFNSLAKDNRLGNIRFDDITKNMEKRRGKIQEEYDLFLTNGDAIAVVEVKYKAHLNDLDKLDRKIRHFKQLFPIYRDYKLYGALAGFHINDEAKSEALRRGYFVLQRRGEIIQAECADTPAVF